MIVTEHCFRHIHNLYNYITYFYIRFIFYNDYMLMICMYNKDIVYIMYIHLTYNCI